jgi:hypothetical protein
VSGTTFVPAAADDDRVRRASRLSGQPAGTLQATLLVEHGEEKPGHGETRAEGGQHQK